MRNFILSVIPLFMVIPAQAGIITFTDRAAFDSLTSTTLDDFELGTEEDGGVELTNPANSGNTPGLLPGYDFASSVSDPESKLFSLGQGLGGTLGNSIGAGFYGDFSIITFNQGQIAVGFDVFSLGTVDVRFFNGASLLTTQTRSLGIDFGVPHFFGGIANSGDLITRVEIQQTIDGPETVDNLAFGELSSVPEPSSFVMAGLFAILFGAWSWRRHGQAATACA